MTQIKVLNERIDATNIELTADKRTLLVMILGLQGEPHYRSLVQIWSSTANMTGELAMASLREDLARGELEEIKATNVALYANNPKHRGCKHCKKTNHKEDQCWKKFPYLIPDWVKEKKEKEESETALVARSFQM